MSHKLSSSFFAELVNGKFSPLLKHIHADHTLDMEIRNDSVNIYYRGGNALRISRTNNKYAFGFNQNYLVSPTLKKFYPSKITAEQDWAYYFAIVKQSIDLYMSRKHGLEREYQQHIVRENNLGPNGGATDYFIIDIEYRATKSCRFDLVALKWQSKASMRKLAGGYKPQLAIIEMKYGDGAIGGESGIKKHFKDIIAFTQDKERTDAFKKEMCALFKQKRELGLLTGLISSKKTNKNEITEFQEEIEIILVIANHKPVKTGIGKTLDSFPEQTKIMRANYTGYGIYEDKLLPVDEFKKTL